MKNKIYLLSFFCFFLACKKTRQINSQDFALKKGLEHFQKAYREYGEESDSLSIFHYDSALYHLTIYTEQASQSTDTNYWHSLHALGYTYYKLKYLQKAEDCLAKDGGVIGKQQFLFSYWKGRVLYELGEYQKAKEIFMPLLRHPYLEQDKNQKAIICLDLANMSANLGDAQESILPYFKTAQVCAITPSIKLNVYRGLGVFYDRSEETYQDYDSANFYFQKARLLANTQNIAPPEMFWYNYATLLGHIAQTDAAQAKIAWDSATVFFQRETRIQESRRDSNNLADIYNNWGYFARKIIYPDLNNSIRYYSQAFQFLFSHKTPYQKVALSNSRSILLTNYTYAGLAKSYFAKYGDTKFHQTTYLDTSLFYYLKVKEAMVHTRKTLGTEESKQILNDILYGVYEPALQAVDFLYQQAGKQDTALQLAYQLIEAGKSLNLLENINNKDALEKSGIPQELVEKEEMLQGAILDLEKEFQRKKDVNILKKKQQKESELAQLLVQLETDRQSHRYYELKYPSTNLTIQQIEDKCKRENTTFIDFFQGNNSVCALYVSPTKTGFLRKEVSDSILNALSANCTQLIDSMKSENVETLKSVVTKFQKPSNLLYQLIFKELDSLLYQQVGQKVVLILDGHLHKIAFDALMYAPSAESYLIKKYNFSYQPSAYLWYHASQNTLTSPRIAAFAPVFDATFYQTYPRAKHQPEIALSESEKTIGKLSKCYDFDTYLREKATIHTFQQKAEDYDILHLATHAYGNDNSPDSTCFALAPNQKGDSTYLGRLYLENIYATPMKKAELALLTACETGKGKIAKGEGVMSLARAFRYAGCQRMITTLWSVDEKETMKTSEDFYAHLAQGKNYGDALYEAKLTKFTNHLPPRDWAGLILIGDAKGGCKLTTSQPFWKKWDWLIVLLLIVGSVVALGIWRKRNYFFT
ncbi:MAG: CHAT domain-containing protein [Bacteroidia bacterium]